MEEFSLTAAEANDFSNLYLPCTLKSYHLSSISDTTLPSAVQEDKLLGLDSVSKRDSMLSVKTCCLIRKTVVQVVVYPFALINNKRLQLILSILSTYSPSTHNLRFHAIFICS
jgi:hypothetical protein